jgi:Flp pilus assembly protein TadD
MNNRLLPKFIITAIAILCIFCSVGYVLAQEPKAASAFGDISDVKREEAGKYRELGLECQQAGNLPEALSYYQKAVSLDPNFVVAYNDLGVLYEAMGSVGRAEENYLKSVKLDPLYSSAYTNLAFLYESQRNFQKAAFYWGKRVEIGDPEDPWTQKAANRLRDIRRSLSLKPFSDEREENVLDLMNDIVREKTEINSDQASLASQAHFKKAKLSFDRGDIATAIKEALDAQQLDQRNPEIEAFIEKAELRALMR